VRRRAPRPLATALEALTASLAPATVLASVQGVWAATVGEAIGAHATPVSERGGVVEVSCDESVWAAELELMGPDLIDRLNAALGRPVLTAMRCRTDRSRRPFSAN
jgi:predicted nucleic acid-binding Zn ribbon protein